MTGDPRGGAIRDADGFALTPAGRYWDAVRLPRDLGFQTMTFVSGSVGAVLMGPPARGMYFLVPPRTTGSWDVPRTSALSSSSYVALPPEHRVRPPGPYWLLSPQRGLLHTRTDELRTAVETALGLRPVTPDCVQPNLPKLTLAQVEGSHCSLCGTRLLNSRCLGMFCTGEGLLTEPTELWGCAPQCAPSRAEL
ncbi:hypothetical protein [Streptomyces sp. MMG1533]|uniref:hypothetical protein n=1 Tax=Streptomyces sp. MMG1533 TaxID=1415546 RepID=UPI0006B03C8D|nr:hypothetical protein [Streptomyces sp. MMG1533]